MSDCLTQWWRRKRRTALRCFSTRAELVARAGEFTNEVVFLRGYHAVNDGGQGFLYYDETSTLPVDDGMVFAAGEGRAGRWLRFWDGVTMFADWWGCRHDGNGSLSATDDQPRLHAALNWSPDCYTVQLGRGVYALGATLVVPVGKTLQGQAGADGGLYQEQQGKASVLQYIGPPALALADCAIALSGGCALRRVTISPGLGTHVTAGVGLSNPVNTTTPLCEDVGVECLNGGWSPWNGSFQHGLMIGAGSPAQDDNLEWNRGFINNAPRSAIAWSGGQPFNTIFNHCRFDNFASSWLNDLHGYTGSARCVSHGTVFEYRGEGQSFGSLTVNGGEIEFYATLLKNFASMTTYIQIRNMEWEGMRRILLQGNYNKSWLPVTLLGGRYSTAYGAENTVYGPDGVTVEIAPGDYSLIYDRGGAVITMIGLDIGSGVTSETEEKWAFVSDMHTTFNATGCTFPNMDIFRRMEMNATPNAIGGTYVRGCRAFSELVNEGNCGQYPDRNGPENADGFARIDGASSHILVKLPKPEWGRGIYTGGDYYGSNGFLPPIQIEAFPTRASAGCAPGAFRARVLPHWSDLYYPVQQFDLVLDEAPGEGEWITYSYRLSLNRSVYAG